MKQPKILVVEDEGVVAADIEESLSKMGYAVVGSAASAVSAIRKAVETEPDLVLMDIKLKGPVDGVDAAGELHERLGIPVVYLTAHADGEILDRAKKSSPSGYVLKPFDERSLRSAVEIALHKHPQEQKLIENEKRLVMALRSVVEAVILTDRAGIVTLMNRAAENLTGRRQSETVGRPVKDVFTSIHATRGSLMSDPVARVLREGAGAGLGDKRVVVGRDGSETWIQGSVVPLRDEEGQVVGAAIVFRPADVSSDEVRDAARSLHSSRLETLGRLAAGVAEDFARTLKSIGDSSRALFHRFPAGDPGRRDLEKLVASAERGLQLSDRLLSYTRRRLPRPVTFAINDLMRNLAPLIECAAGENVETLTQLGPDAGNATADPGHVEHVILSLVAAAREAMPDGGKLSIETACVELSEDPPGGLPAGWYALVSLSHTGSDGPGDARRPPEQIVELLRLAGGGIVSHAEPGRVTAFEIFLPSVA
ncbi:MAG: response regulator [Bryobacteraceae bacterium]|nr:response regulator [Bryobacteraceae bacterium]